MRANEWVIKLKLLTTIDAFYPQGAYCAFTSGFRQKINCIIKTIPNISHLLQPTENVIQEFITFLLEWKTCNDDECHLLFLPVKLDGMAITNITSISDIEYQTSKKTTKKLMDKLKNQKDESSTNLENSSNQQRKFKSLTELYDNILKDLQSKMTPA